MINFVFITGWEKENKKKHNRNEFSKERKKKFNKSYFYFIANVNLIINRWKLKFAWTK